MQSFSQTISGVGPSIRGAAKVATAAALLIVGSSVGAHAQTYIGNAYDAGANVGLGLNVLGIASLSIDTGAAVNYQGALPAAGGNKSGNLLAANANINYLVTLPVLSISGNPNGATQVGSASTVGASGVVNSTSTINNVNLLSGLLTASTITSNTTATYSSALASGSSTITNLVFGGLSVTVTGLPNQTVGIYGGVGDSTLRALLTINEQTFAPDHSYLTTNALDLQVYDTTLDTVGLNGKVVVASSTAGFSGVNLGSAASAPEPGSISLLSSLALPGLMGAVGVYRRRRKGANTAAA